jgi:hypothetical protein
MGQTKQRFASFEEYLSYDDGSDKLYELYHGELIEIPPESGINVLRSRGSKTVTCHLKPTSFPSNFPPHAHQQLMAHLN